jgi:hypothetical protein
MNLVMHNRPSSLALCVGQNQLYYNRVKYQEDNMLRNDLLHDIRERLSREREFIIDDFALINSKNGSSELLHIEYRPDSEFNFHVLIPSHRSEKTQYGNYLYEIKGTVSPGNLSLVENVKFDNRSELLNGISEWIQNIYRELLAIPIYRMADIHKDQLDQLFKQFEKLPEEYFSQEEADLIRNRLDELEARVQQ